MSFIAGAYKWKFGGLPLGITETTPELEYTQLGEPILADVYGGNQIDAIYTGQTAFLSVTFQEFDKAGLQALLTRPGGVMGRLAELGCPFIDNASDVLIGERMESALCATPNVVIAYRAAVAPGVPTRFGFGSRLRNVPMLLQLFPYVRGGFLQTFELLATLPSDVSKYGALSIAEALDVGTFNLFLGTHDPTTNSPALADGVGTLGQTYNVPFSGVRDYGSGNITFVPGDQIQYNGTIWIKL